MVKFLLAYASSFSSYNKYAYIVIPIIILYLSTY